MFKQWEKDNNICINNKYRRRKCRKRSNHNSDDDTNYRDKLRNSMFTNDILNGKVVKKDCYNRILLSKDDQKEWELKRAIRNVKVIIKGRITDS